MSSNKFEPPSIIILPDQSGKILVRAKVPLSSKHKTGVIDELLDLFIFDKELIDKDEVFKDIIKREELSSTGLEKGIAIPHAKTKGVSMPLLGVGISLEGIPFDSLDGEKSHIFFMLLNPLTNQDLHIDLLKNITFMVNDDKIRTTLLKLSSEKDIIKMIKEFIEK